MEPYILIDESRTPEGVRIKLTERSGHFDVSVCGSGLMSSQEHHSEEKMAELGCERVAMSPGARVLVGGLGMGYTLRAALDQVGEDARVVVVELIDAVVKWNRGPLAHLADHPLDDPRTEQVTDDLVDYLSSGVEPFDVILLDVDNGPESFTTDGNDRLYDRRGLKRLRAMLRPGGTLVVWSAFECPAFLKRMNSAGFKARAERALSRGAKGARHTLFVGHPSA